MDVTGRALLRLRLPRGGNSCNWRQIPFMTSQFKMDFESGVDTEMFHLLAPVLCLLSSDEAISLKL
jgi:hypothetical protein